MRPSIPARLRGLFGAGPPPGAELSGQHATLRRVRAAATRVALISTAIVAAVYLVISITVTLIVTSRLTSAMDSHLTSTLAATTSAPGPAPPLAQAEGSQLDYWFVTTDGSQYSCDPQSRQCSVPSARLPTVLLGAGSAPQTVSIDGSSYRVAGTDLPPGLRIQTYETDPNTGITVRVSHGVDRLIVGESLSGVTNAQVNVILAESIVGPLLLVAVFLGALTVGRRVAAPIELARLRQLEFTADASHELRTPLSVIEAQTSLALAEPRDPAWYRAAFQRVQGESWRIRRLVEDLLWLARFDSTRERAQAEHVDVAILAQIAADRFTAVAEAKHVRLAVRPAPVPLVVLAPPEWLDRLLGVLLDNACKYVPEGGTVDVAVWAEGGRIRLAVEDSGPGIPVAERPRIFDRFHRATDRPGGAGLGLAIANSVVTATGGRWQIGESPAGGASMGVSWPRSLTGVSAPQPAPAPPPPGTDPQPAR